MNNQSGLWENLRSLLEWPSSYKARLVLGLLFFEQTLYWISLQAAIYVPFLQDTFDQEQCKIHSNYFLILLLITALLYFVVFFASRIWRETTLYEHIAAQNFGLSHIYFGYTIGLLSLPAGVVLAAAPVVGFIYVDRKAVSYAYLSGLVTFIVFLYATLTDKIPYAPLAISIASADGQMLPSWVAVYAFFAAPHLFSLFAIAYYVLQRWREREEEVQRLSFTDSLTDLLNRRSIMLNLEEIRKQSHIKQQPFSVLMIDLDHFKQINDSWGHDVGDKVLQHTANILKQTVRQLDYVGRYGGEEFLLILPGLEEPDAAKIADRIRQSLADYPTEFADSTSIILTTSQGLYCYHPDSNLKSEDIIQRADAALYEAKNNGRNQLVIASP